MPTHTYLKPEQGAVLRHGHGNANAPDPEKEQWHDAYTFHRSDPDAHTREESWSYPQWSRNNGDLSLTRKAELVTNAKRLHDQAYRRHTGSLPDDAYNEQSTPQVDVLDTDSDTDTDTEQDLPKWTTPEDSTDIINDTATDTAPPTDAEYATLSDQITKAQTLAVMAAKAAGIAADAAKTADGTANTALHNVSNLTTIVTDHYNQLLSSVNRLEQLERAAAVRVEHVIRNDDDQIIRSIKCFQHKKFPLLLKHARNLKGARRNIWVQGPAGAGKTHGFEMLAEILGLPYEYQGAIDSPYKLSGHYNANGLYLSTAFRRIYEGGGVILLDEVDAGDPRALLEINAALANSRAAFPDGLVTRHPDCIVGASANTWGLGANAAYSGRNKLDAAFLNRFVYMNWDYDEDLERQIAGDDPHGWVSIVQQVRADLFRAGTPGMVVSPRSSQLGCEMLQSGDYSFEEVVESTFGNYRPHTMWPQIGRAAEDFAKRSPTPAPAPSITVTTSNPELARTANIALEEPTVNMSNVRVFSNSYR